MRAMGCYAAHLAYSTGNFDTIVVEIVFMKEVKSKEVVFRVARIVLKTIFQLGKSIPEMIAPNARKEFKLFRDDYKRKTVTPFYINKTVESFRKQGLIQFNNRGGRRHVVLTNKGRQRLLKYQLSEVELGAKPKKWDKRWRVIIFDISEEKRGYRDMLRDGLVKVGFERLQNSVWIYPYECEEFVHLLKTEFDLGDDVIHMTVDRLENDARIKRLFGLD